MKTVLNPKAIMMKAYLRPLLLCIALIFCFSAYSITIYQINYEFKNLPEFPKYTAFLVRYGNGTGFMRVKYSNKANTETYVVHMEFIEVEGRSKIDGLPHLTLQFKGKSPKYIINSTGTKEEYNPDVLWFSKEANDKNFKPWGVTSQNVDGSFEYGKILDVKVINTADLTKTFVKNFFLENESFYTNLFKPQTSEVVTNLPPPPVKTNPGNTNPTNTTTTVLPAKLHFICVAATNDPRIGYSVQKDVMNISSQIRDVATFLNLGLNYVEVSGAKFGKAGVESAIANLKPAANDIVIFYYSGHGYSAEGKAEEQYPQFDLRQSRFDDILVATLNASDVLSKIKAKSARLNLVITDCCNSNLGLLKPEGKNYALTTKSLMSWEKSFCYDLFMKSKGSIIATAAKKGQYAYGNTDVGGYFTSNLITAMEKYLSKFQTSTPTWQQIISEAQTSTVTLSLSNMCTANTSCRQDPVFAVNVTK
jgi:hypothetical protein